MSVIAGATTRISTLQFLLPNNNNEKSGQLLIREGEWSQGTSSSPKRGKGTREREIEPSIKEVNSADVSCNSKNCTTKKKLRRAKKIIKKKSEASTKQTKHTKGSNNKVLAAKCTLEQTMLGTVNKDIEEGA